MSCLLHLVLRESIKRVSLAFTSGTLAEFTQLLDRLFVETPFNRMDEDIEEDPNSHREEK